MIKKKKDRNNNSQHNSTHKTKHCTIRNPPRKAFKCLQLINISRYQVIEHVKYDQKKSADYAWCNN